MRFNRPYKRRNSQSAVQGNSESTLTISRSRAIFRRMSGRWYGYALAGAVLTVLVLTSSPCRANEKEKILVGHIQDDKVEESKLRNMELFETRLTNAIKRYTPRYSVAYIGDLATKLELKKIYEKMDCDTEACLGEIGRATDASFLVFPKLMKRGKRFYFQITFIDHRSDRVVRKSDLLEFTWSKKVFEAIIYKAVYQVFSICLLYTSDAADE